MPVQHDLELLSPPILLPFMVAEEEELDSRDLRLPKNDLSPSLEPRTLENLLKGETLQRSDSHPLQHNWVLPPQDVPVTDMPIGGRLGLTIGSLLQTPL